MTWFVQLICGVMIVAACIGISCLVVAMAEMKRPSFWREYRAALSREIFREEVVAAVNAGISVNTIARKFGVSRTTANRWFTGDVTPHQLVRVDVICVLQKMRMDLAGR